MKRSSYRSSCLIKIVSLVTLVIASLLLDAHAQTKFGFVNLGAGKTSTITVTIPHGGTLNAIYVRTGGTLNLDFTQASGGTCTLGTIYADNSTCTVNVSFTPKFPGTRYGGVTLYIIPSGQSAVFATAYVQGTGFGPQTAFTPATQTELGSVNNLTGEAVDGNSTAFFTGGQVDAGEGPGGEIDGYWGSLPTVQSLTGALPQKDPDAVVVDGAGIVCFSDGYFSQGTVFVPVPNPGYIYDPNSQTDCPFSSGPVVADGAGNQYLLPGYQQPGLTKMIRQPNGSFTSSTIANLAGTGLAVDRDGDVFVASGQLYEETPKSGGTYTQTTIPLDLTGVSTVSIDGIGNLYLTADTGLFKESLQANGSYIESPIAGAFDPAPPTIQTVDLFGNIYPTTSTPDGYYTAPSNDLYRLSYNQPPTLTFATTAMGSTSSDSPQVVTISNSGNTALTFSAITFPADFTESPTGSTCTSSIVLAAGASCTLAIDFTPVTASKTSPVQLTEKVIVTTNTLSHSGAQQAITVTGSETIPASLSIAPSSLAFAPAAVGTTSAAQMITLQNTGAATITLGTMAFKGTNTKSFIESTKTCGATLVSGATCTLSIAFKPAVTGNLSASLGISDNVPGAPQYVPLTGTGN